MLNSRAYAIVSPVPVHCAPCHVSFKVSSTSHHLLLSYFSTNRPTVTPLSHIWSLRTLRENSHLSLLPFIKIWIVAPCVTIICRVLGMQWPTDWWGHCQHAAFSLIEHTVCSHPWGLHNQSTSESCWCPLQCAHHTHSAVGKGILNGKSGLIYSRFQAILHTPTKRKS